MGDTQSTPAAPVDNRPRNGPNLFLNVYTQAPGAEGAAQQPQVPGFGVYHTGLQVHEREYTFAGGNFDGSGVQEQAPKSTPPGSQWIYNQTVDLGKTTLSDKDVMNVLSSIRSDFPAKTYDLMGKNCNHFTEVLATRLNVHHKYPGWVNRAAKWGNSMRGSQIDPVAQEKRRIEQETMKKQQEETQRAALQSKQQALKMEPPPEAEGVLEIQINCPNGTKTKRRFLASDTVLDVMVFVCAFDLSLGSHKTFHLRQNMPKKLYTEHQQTLTEAGFSKRENLFIEKILGK